MSDEKVPSLRAREEENTLLTPMGNGGKIPAVVRKFIIDQSAQCKSSLSISRLVKENYNLEISTAAVTRWKRKFREQIIKAQGDQLAIARATQPLATLEYRLKLYQANIKREIKKGPMADGRVINDALRNAGEEIRANELFQLKRVEAELKQDLLKNQSKEGGSAIEEIIAMVERRVVYARKRTEENKAIIQMVDWARDESLEEQENQP